MMYENEDNQFYIILGDALYEISMNTMEYKVMKENLETDGYAVSDSNQYIAWLDGEDRSHGTAVQVWNLETGTSFEVKAETGEYIRPLGFMENDFIYGTAKVSDVVKDAAGNDVFPMYRVCILDTESDHKILKEYQKPGYYVSGIEIEDYTIYLNRDRAQWDGICGCRSGYDHESGCRYRENRRNRFHGNRGGTDTLSAGIEGKTGDYVRTPADTEADCCRRTTGDTDRERAKP